MKNFAVASALAVAGLGNALAAPVLLNAADFNTAIAPLSAVVEDFEGFASGSKPSPFTLANSTFTSDVATVYPANTYITPTSQTLGNNAPDPTTGRVFSGFAAGTVLFGLELPLFAASDVLDITVVGLSGTVTFQQTLGSFGGFIGVQDTQGLSSVTFRNIGSGFSVSQYLFDNVTTGATTAVPEPSSLALIGLALAAASVTRRRRN